MASKAISAEARQRPDLAPRIACRTKPTVFVTSRSARKSR
jgi:hypothetical protein